MEIKINLDLPKPIPPKDYDAKFDRLESALRNSNNDDVIAELSAIKRLLASQGNELLEKRLSMIEKRIMDIPDSILSSNRMLSNKLDNINMSSVQQAISSNTNRILDALLNKKSVDISDQLGIIESKLNRMSLPSTVVVHSEPTRQVVPYPC